MVCPHQLQVRQGWVGGKPCQCRQAIVLQVQATQLAAGVAAEGHGREAAVVEVQHRQLREAVQQATWELRQARVVVHVEDNKLGWVRYSACLHLLWRVVQYVGARVSQPGLQQQRQSTLSAGRMTIVVQ